MDDLPTGKRMLSWCNAADVEEQAAKWLIQIDGEPSHESSAALDSWLLAHPRQRAAFLRLSIAWRRMDRLRHFNK
jgi:ferric-dicitrate binding protein FerR (iron transport regulator)